MIIYDNVTAVVETDAPPATPISPASKSSGPAKGAAAGAKHGQLAIGTLIKIGDTWKTFDLPKNLTGDQKGAIGGYFFQPPLTGQTEVNLPAPSGNVSPELKKLADDLEQLDKRLLSAKPADQAKLNATRADLLDKIVSVAAAEDRGIWIRQYAEAVAAAIQTGAFPDGIRRLESLLTKVSELPDSGELTPYVKFRLLTATYNRDISQPDANFEKLNNAYQEESKKFVEQYPTSPDAAEAMIQLAINAEFSGKPDEAIGWFKRIATDFSKSDLAPKASGAIRRLESVGKAIPLAGKTLEGKTFDLASLKGKIVLVHYWATWADPCKPDLTTIKALQSKYAKDGFVPVGVNLDNSAKDAMDYVRQEKLAWSQLYDQGGLDGTLASNLGVLTLPTMILIGKDGRVINRSINAGELET